LQNLIGEAIDEFSTTPDSRNESMETALSHKAGRLEFCEISFGYSPTTKELFSKISGQFDLGDVVAIYGPSGSGKSTLIDLILGLLTPTTGEIRFNGVNIHANLTKWHANVGYVPQDPVLFDGTVRQNIQLHEAQAVSDNNFYRLCLQRAGVDTFLRDTSGFDNINVGEDGANISGGQRQRIAIARALYRDPAIICFDEPTSALDGESRDSIIDTVLGLRMEKIIFIVSHDPEVIKICNKKILISW
jgi:ABC-type bacteriocin/lantibiotic exporter with double-glycine peptidase domain